MKTNGNQAKVSGPILPIRAREEVGTHRRNDHHIGWPEVLAAELGAKESNRHVRATTGDDRFDEEDDGKTTKIVWRSPSIRAGRTR